MQSTTQLVMTESHDKQISYKFFVVLGFLIWLIATSILRLWGHTFFIPNDLIMSVNFLELLFFLPLMLYGIFRWQNVPPQKRITVAICLAIPSMLLDVPTTYFFPQLFPNMPSSANGSLGAWLLWGYAIILLTGVIASQWDKSKTV